CRRTVPSTDRHGRRTFHAASRSARSRLKYNRRGFISDQPHAMPKLFLVYLGGRAPNANIELHDVQFVAGDSIQDTFEQLRQHWFGTVPGLHLDAYLEVRFVDGFRIELRRKPSEDRKKLYFVNLGGYDPASVAELHQFGLFVASSPAEAKQNAKQSLLTLSE